MEQFVVTQVGPWPESRVDHGHEFTIVKGVFSTRRRAEVAVEEMEHHRRKVIQHERTEEGDPLVTDWEGFFQNSFYINILTLDQIDDLEGTPWT